MESQAKMTERWAVTSDGVVPDDCSAFPQSDTTADQLLIRLLDLIITIDSTSELSVARVGTAMGVPMLVTDDDARGHAAWLTTRWSYWLEYDPDDHFGPTLVLRFAGPDSESAPMTEISRIDFDQFSTALQHAGFDADIDYGELGEIIQYDFRRLGLEVSVSTRPEVLDKGSDLTTHACIRSVTVLPR
jgi:hypothetical protein